jgi:hypothetical protein
MGAFPFMYSADPVMFNTLTALAGQPHRFTLPAQMLYTCFLVWKNFAKLNQIHKCLYFVDSQS